MKILSFLPKNKKCFTVIIFHNLLQINRITMRNSDINNTFSFWLFVCRSEAATVCLITVSGTSARHDFQRAEADLKITVVPKASRQIPACFWKIKSYKVIQMLLSYLNSSFKSLSLEKQSFGLMVETIDSSLGGQLSFVLVRDCKFEPAGKHK